MKKGKGSFASFLLENKKGSSAVFPKTMEDFLYSLEDLFECFFTILLGDGHNTGDFFKYM